MSRAKDPTHGATEKNLSLHVGQPVYVKDLHEAWREAIVFELTVNQVVTKDENGQKRVQNIREVCLRGDSDLHEVEDLTKLTPLNEATVLSCLDQRFHRGDFYTKAGCTIVAANPFQDVSHLYTLDTMKKYRDRKEDLPPHIYQIAKEAYWRLQTDLDKADQSIVVSGESGAGKTVSTKHMLRYITTVASNDQFTNRLNSSTGTAGEIENKIIGCNPILEAFGNAATPRNENSSRFGKFIDLQFDREGIVQGAAIQVFLLEKTRVPRQGKGECNFHIFYQLAQAKAEAENLPKCLQNLISELSAVEFRITPPSPDTVENRSLLETMEALMDLGLQENRLLEMLQVIAAILYLCNVDFKSDHRDDDKSLLDRRGGHGGQYRLDFCVKRKGSGAGLAGAARMLGVEGRELEKVLLHRHIQAGSRARQSICEKPVSPSEAGSRRDCLAMLLYAQLFDWLVEYINQQITAVDFNKAIGLLDIYGFEVLKENSLEQLCINYANERLQQHFTRHILHNLQKEYEEEKVKWEHISYHDNKASLEVLEGRTCTFDLLNEQVFLGRAVDDRQLAESLQEMVKSKNGKTDNLTWPTGFTIQHYAGPVPYLTENLVIKNKDNIPVELVALLQGSQCPFIHDMFAGFQVQQGQGRKMKTVLIKFKSSLDELMQTLESRHVHYVRCIKPNPLNKAGLLQRPYCLTQLEACGIIEATHISRDGYAARFDYKAFQRRYGLFLPKTADGDSTPGTGVSGDKKEELYRSLDQHYQQQLDLTARHSKTDDQKHRERRKSGLNSVAMAQACCAAILTSALGEGCLDQHCIQSQFGLSKLFLSQQQLEQLEAARANHLSRRAVVIQMAWRHYRTRQLVERLLEAARQVMRERKAQQVIQRNWRLYVMRKTLRRLHNLRQLRAVRVIRTAWRRCKTRRWQQRNAARMIWQAWLQYKVRMQAAIKIQKAVRRWLYRKALRGAGILDSMDADADRSGSRDLTAFTAFPAPVQDNLQSGQNSPAVLTSSPADQRSPPLNRDSLAGCAQAQRLGPNHAIPSPDSPKYCSRADRNRHPRSSTFQGLEVGDGSLSEMNVVRNGLSNSDGCLSQDSGVIDPDEVIASSSMESSVDPSVELERGIVFMSPDHYIVSRRNIMPHRFHIKKTCLAFAHLPPPPQLSLADCLTPVTDNISIYLVPSTQEERKGWE